MKNRKILILLLSAIFLSVVVVFTSRAQETETVYVNEINRTVLAGSGTVFTKDFNNTSKIKVEPTEGNLIWCAVISAKPTEKTNVFEVTFTKKGFQTEEEVTIPEGGFIYAAHVDDTEEAIASGLFEISSQNMDKTMTIEVGDLITLSGINLVTGTITEDAFIYLDEVDVEESEVSTPEESLPDETSPEDISPASSVDIPATGDNDTFAFIVAIFITACSLLFTSAFIIRKNK